MPISEPDEFTLLSLNRLRADYRPSLRNSTAKSGFGGPRRELAQGAATAAVRRSPLQVVKVLHMRKEATPRRCRSNSADAAAQVRLEAAHGEAGTILSSWQSSEDWVAARNALVQELINGSMMNAAVLSVSTCSKNTPSAPSDARCPGFQPN
jgi:hypothetical protein